MKRVDISEFAPYTGFLGGGYPQTRREPGKLHDFVNLCGLMTPSSFQRFQTAFFCQKVTVVENFLHLCGFGCGKLVSTRLSN